MLDLNSTQPISGWFQPPATAEYRFYVACGSSCDLYLDHENPYVAGSPVTKQPDGELIAYKSSGSSGWRQYFNSFDDGHIDRKSVV